MKEYALNIEHNLLSYLPEDDFFFVELDTKANFFRVVTVHRLLVEKCLLTVANEIW